MTKIDEGVDEIVSTRWGKRILLFLAILGIGFALFKIFG